ncbi:Ceramide-1-phosphate transfer protein [Halotydeus destructor]|nr:Ceramide-1-phosphate transfer protein [Halotydeus destructor]
MDEQIKTENSKFDPIVIVSALEQCAKEPMSLSMDEYLTAYRELNKFFQILGTVFSFVANDVTNKIQILEQYRADPVKGSSYHSFQSMIKYEQENKSLKDKKTPSGARTALRLHRALRFFATFMKQLSELDNKTGSGSVARDCYNQTLAEYHPWYIQKTASVAMYALPTKEQLIAKAFGGNCKGDETQNSSKSASECMNKISQVSDAVYNAVEKLYAENDLLNLP